MRKGGGGSAAQVGAGVVWTVWVGEFWPILVPFKEGRIQSGAGGGELGGRRGEGGGVGGGVGGGSCLKVTQRK